ncbi:hypothetical protein NEFER03_1990 [Nematocida sp. LUAm3]|nr:hypothetical protein NEFER03_1990 [Nematocida sp. LUAm3]KAI5176074.1 hypothetical protein NEFER02_1908 [Nematocida sp. LUAm2]KAI5177118.1 hypothetical protein NEFER01_0393 [Nematocida sp. LUAm1]
MRLSNLIKNENQREANHSIGSQINLIESIEDERPEETSSAPPPTTSVYQEDYESPESNQVYPIGLVEDSEPNRILFFFRRVFQEFSNIPNYNKLSFLALISLLTLNIMQLFEMMSFIISNWNVEDESYIIRSTLYVILPLSVIMCFLYCGYIYLLLARGNSNFTTKQKLAKLAIMVIASLIVGSIVGLILFWTNVLLVDAIFANEHYGLFYWYVVDVICTSLFCAILIFSLTKDFLRKPNKTHFFKVITTILTLFTVFYSIIYLYYFYCKNIANAINTDIVSKANELSHTLFRMP